MDLLVENMVFRSRIINQNENTNLDTLEFISTDSALGSLRRSDFKNNVIVQLPLQLSFGDLKSLDNYDRSCLRKLYPHDDYFPFEDGFIFQKEIEELRKYVSKAKKIRVWSSQIAANEFLLLLYICYLFPNKNISAVFADEYNPYCWSIGCMTFNEVNELSKKEHLLTMEEKELYINEWNRMVKENSTLRYIKNKEIKSVPINYFDKDILSYLGKQEMKFITLVGKLMGNAVIDNDSDSIYAYLINRLIEQGKIEVVRIDENDQKLIRTASNI